MSLGDIRRMPTSITEIPLGSSGVHESCLRSFHILNKVIDLLMKGTPAEVILEIVEDLKL